MPLTYRTLIPSEFDDFFIAEGRAYSKLWPAEDVEALRPLFDYGRSIAAVDGPQIVGGAAYFPFDLSVPGAKASAGGVTFVFVIPSHRRRGILTELMRRQLEAIHAEGIVLAGLHAAESVIYGRFGYGSAAPTEVIEIERAHAGLARDVTPAGSFRMVDDAEAAQLFPPVYEAYRARTPGLFSRDDAWWKLRLRKSGRIEGSPDWMKVVYERDGQPQGYAIYSSEGGWEDSVPQTRLQVHEMAWADPAPPAPSNHAYRALWKYLLNLDIVKTVSAYSGPNPPLWWMVADPRRLRRRTRDGLWVRLVDVPAALEARQYAADGAMTIGVEDAFCPWNSGTYRLEVSGGEASCERVTGAADLTVGPAALASCYLGANDFHTLATAGLAEENTPGALSLASAMFRWHTPPMTSAPEPLT